MNTRHQSRLNRFAVLIVLLGACLLQATAMATPFTLITNTATSPPKLGAINHGIARVGNQWFTADSDSGWAEYDLEFNRTGTKDIIPTSGETRGLVLNSNTGTLFLGDRNTNTIFEVDTTGVIHNSFASGGVVALNALAFNPNNNSLFAVHFNGEVRELTTTGGFLNSFSVGKNLTGAAFDAFNNTLLLMDSDADVVREYSTTGLLLDTPLPVDAVVGNGLGLHYDSLSGVLHVTSQGDNIAIWQRFVVPEPSTFTLAILGLLGLSGRGRRRRRQQTP